MGKELFNTLLKVGKESEEHEEEGIVLIFDTYELLKIVEKRVVYV